MSSNAIHRNLLRTVQDAYTSSADMMAFTPFPRDVKQQHVTPHHCPCSDVFREDKSLTSQKFGALQEAIRAAGPLAHWRATYKDTDIGSEFMDRFGCYCIVGQNAPFASDAIRLFMVYMPSGLYYPWHNHPAEEIYMVLSGSAVFKRQGFPDETLCEDDTSFHSSNQPHAMETLAQPVLCLVAWKDEFQTPPVLTAQSAES